MSLSNRDVRQMSFYAFNIKYLVLSDNNDIITNQVSLLDI